MYEDLLGLRTIRSEAKRIIDTINMHYTSIQWPNSQASQWLAISPADRKQFTAGAEFNMGQPDSG